MKGRILFLWLYFTSNLAVAQAPGLTVDFISTEQGLPHKLVNCITQDNRGFMWVGTANGLFRYDGYSFYDYTKHVSGSDQLKGLNIGSLLKDKEGNIWIGYNDGLSKMDPVTGKTSRIPLTGYTGTEQRVKRIMLDSQNRILIYLADNTLLCYDSHFKLRFIYHFSIRVREDGLDHPVILEDADHSFWLPTFFNGIDHISAEGRFLEHFRQVKDAGKNWPVKVLMDPYGIEYKFALGPRFDKVIQHPALVVNAAQHVLLRPYASPSGILDQAGNEWNIKWNTVHLTDPVAKKELEFTLSYSNDFFYDYPWLNVYQGSDGIIWTCSRKGIFKIHYRRSPFVNFLYSTPSPQKAGISIRGITEDKSGNIWIGSYPYAANSTVNNTVLSVIRASNKNTAKPFLFYQPDGGAYDVGGSPVYRMHDEEEYLLASSEANYMLHIEKRTGRVSKDTCPFDVLAPIKAFIYRNDSTVFVTSGTAIGIYRKRPGQKARFRLLYKNKEGDPFDGVNNFFDAGNGKCWAVGNDGLYLLNDEGVLLRSFSMGNVPSLLLPVLDINYLYREDEHLFWLGTRHGMIRLDTLKKNSRVYTTNDGLPNNNIMSIIPDEFGFLWLSTDNGLSRFNPAQEIFINYDVNDELPHNEFNRMASLKASDGRIYFGGLNGVTAVYPRDVDTSLSNLQPQLVSYSKYDGKRDSVFIFQASEVSENRIIFSHNDRLFNFRVMLPAYRNTSKNRFLYKLQGWDKEWQSAPNTNMISYSFLPAGDYELVVKGASAGDTWARNEYRLKIKVLVAWYKTWWFYVLLAAVLGLLVYTFYRYRINQVLKLEKIRNKISADLHDELGSVLTQISLQSEMVSSNIYDEEEKKNELKNISNTSRRAIHAMSDIVWSIKAGHDKTSSLLDRMRDHADLMLQPLNTEVDFTVTGIDEQKEMDNTVRQELFLIYKEAIHNIVKHSQPSGVQIRLENGKEGFEMEITNDINQLQSYGVLGGNGLKNMQERALGIRARLEIKKEENRFTLTVRREWI